MTKRLEYLSERRAVDAAGPDDYVLAVKSDDLGRMVYVVASEAPSDGFAVVIRRPALLPVDYKQPPAKIAAVFQQHADYWNARGRRGAAMGCEVLAEHYARKASRLAAAAREAHQ